MKLDLFRRLTPEEINFRMSAYEADLKKVGLELEWPRDPDDTGLKTLGAGSIHVYNADVEVVYQGEIGWPINELACKKLEAFYRKFVRDSNKDCELEFNYQLKLLLPRMFDLDYRLRGWDEDEFLDGLGLAIICPNGDELTLSDEIESLHKLRKRVDRDEAAQILERYIRYSPSSNIIIREDCFIIDHKTYALRPEVLKEYFPGIYGKDIESLRE